MSDYLTPIKLIPAFQSYLWGGSRLRDIYHKPAPQDWDKIAESWELSTHPNGLSTIANGPFAGDTFATYLQQAGPKILGQRFSQAHLPILIKLIDAMDDLSIQVHPNDDYAHKYENASGKTEVWYVIDALPDAFIYYGFKKRITADDFEKRIKNQTLLEVLQKVPAKKGDVFFIPAGTLHAIGKGILIAEIQQCCDLTYRIYDYNRLGPDGKTRELHLEKALDVTLLEPAKVQPAQLSIPLNQDCEISTLTTYKDFIIKKITFNNESHLELLSLTDTYQVILITEGEFNLIYQDKSYKLMTGETIFLPAGLGTYYLEGKGDLLLITDN